MKRGLFTILIILLNVSSGLKGQTAELNSKLAKVGRYREDINNNILSGNIEAIDVRRYFDLDSADLAWLALDEEELLLLITGKFEILLEDLLIRNTKFYKGKNIRDIDRNDSRAGDAFRYTQHYFDSLTGNVFGYFKTNHFSIQNNIRKADLEIEDQDFLSLFVDYYLATTDFCDVSKDIKMVESSRIFLDKYPNSEFRDFIEDYINIEFKEGAVGFGIYLSSGTAIYTGSLDNFFSNPTIFMVNLDFIYKRVELNIGAGASLYSGIKEEFNFDTLWLTDHKYNYSPIFESSLGYRIYESKNMNISPFIGARYIGIGGRSDTDSIYFEGIKIKPGNPLTFGITFNYKFGYGSCNNNFLNRRGGFAEKIFADIRLRIAYQNPAFSKTVTDLNGGLLFISLGIGFDYFPSRRIMKK